MKRVLIVLLLIALCINVYAVDPPKMRNFYELEGVIEAKTICWICYFVVVSKNVNDALIERWHAEVWQNGKIARYTWGRNIIKSPGYSNGWWSCVIPVEIPVDVMNGGPYTIVLKHYNGTFRYEMNGQSIVEVVKE